ncbi:hypothetical protein VTK73DRAFT_2301 [Phialemonium thermophilum]|uniref:Uncharacterized protein n=1 Tax=Phialemonium thermophilum TaxID=223376 RepID=A0ABR3VSD4_9PEZI
MLTPGPPVHPPRRLAARPARARGRRPGRPPVRLLPLRPRLALPGRPHRVLRAARGLALLVQRARAPGLRPRRRPRRGPGAPLPRPRARPPAGRRLARIRDDAPEPRPVGALSAAAGPRPIRRGRPRPDGPHRRRHAPLRRAGPRHAARQLHGAAPPRRRRLRRGRLRRRADPRDAHPAAVAVREAPARPCAAAVGDHGAHDRGGRGLGGRLEDVLGEWTKRLLPLSGARAVREALLNERRRQVKGVFPEVLDDAADFHLSWVFTHGVNMAQGSSPVYRSLSWAPGHADRPADHPRDDGLPQAFAIPSPSTA